MNSKINPKKDSKEGKPQIPHTADHKDLCQYSRSFINKLEARPLKLESLMNLDHCSRFLMSAVSDHLRFIGFKRVPFDDSPELFSTKKSEAVETLKVDMVKEDYQMSENFLNELCHLNRSFVAFLLSKELKSAKPISGESVSDRWFTVLTDIYEWLDKLSQFPSENVRVSNLKLVLQTADDVFKSQRSFDNKEFKEAFQTFFSTFLSNGLLDPLTTVRLNILDWIHHSLELFDMLLEHIAFDAESASRLFKSLLINIYRQPPEVRNPISELICKLIEQANKKTLDVFLKTTRASKHMIIKSVIESSTKDIESTLKLVSTLQAKFKTFDSEDLTKVYMMMFHDNKLIGKRVLEFFLESTDFEKNMDVKDFDNEKFFDFAALSQGVVDALSARDPSPDMSTLFEMITDAKQTKDLDLMIWAQVLEHLSLKEQTPEDTRSLKGFLQMLIGISRSKNKTKSRTLYEQIKQDFSDVCRMSTFHNCLLEFLELVFVILREETSEDLASLLPEMNEIMLHTRNIAVLEALFNFLASKRRSFQAIDELFSRAYEFEKHKISNINLFENPTEEVVLMVGRANLLSKAWQQTNNIVKDFENIEELMRNSLALKYGHVDPKLVIYCLDFRLNCLRSRLYEIVVHTDTEEVENDLVVPFVKTIVNDMLEAMEFGTEAKGFSLEEIRAIQDAGYTRLIAALSLVSLDEQSKYSFMFYELTDEDWERVLGYLDRFLSLHASKIEQLAHGSETQTERPSGMMVDKVSLRLTREQVLLKVTRVIQSLFDFLFASHVNCSNGVSHRFIEKVFEYLSYDSIGSIVNGFLIAILDKEASDKDRYSFFKMLYLTLQDSRFPAGQLKHLCKAYTKAMNQFCIMKVQNKVFQESIDHHFYAVLLVTIKDALNDSRDGVLALKAAPFLISKRRPLEKNIEETKNFVFKILEMKRSLNIEMVPQELRKIIEDVTDAAAQLLGMTRIQRAKETEAKLKNNTAEPAKKTKSKDTKPIKVPRSVSKKPVFKSKAKIEEIGETLRSLRRESEEKHELKMKRKEQKQVKKKGLK